MRGRWGRHANQAALMPEETLGAGKEEEEEELKYQPGGGADGPGGGAGLLHTPQTPTDSHHRL